MKEMTCFYLPEWNPIEIFRVIFAPFVNRIFFVVAMKINASRAISSTCFFPDENIL